MMMGGSNNNNTIETGSDETPATQIVDVEGVVQLSSSQQQQQPVEVVADNKSVSTSSVAPPSQGTGDIRSSLGWCPLPEVKLAIWDPENEKSWNKVGKYIAHRNLLVSMLNLFCGFGVWLSWSVIASKIQLMHDEDPNLYPFQDWGSPTGSDYNLLLYSLPAVAGLSGGTMRVANSFMTQIVGGRNVVAHTSLMLMAAMILTAFSLKSPTTPFNLLLVAAWLSGTGGGAFASSMSNISFLYPKSQQGYCLGMNGGIGNLGVSMTQLLLPIFMGLSFGKDPLSPYVDGWPNHAGWFWWPICLLGSILAFFWMSNHPDHGNHDHHHNGGNPKFYNVFYYYWFEIVGLLAGLIAIIVLVVTRNSKIQEGSIGYKFLMVILALALEHTALYFLSPKSSYPQLREQAKIFKDKHTYIMTFLYTMCFGSFIGFSGAFPKLITDIFGYVTADGCFYTTIGDDGSSQQEFVEGGTEHDCVANGGEWGYETITNPNAPNVFAFAWLGAFIGSIIRPFGGIIADRHGGAKVTQILIVWCTVATICLGVLVSKTRELDNPENNFGLFVFLFLNVFFCLGAMNGTTFRTIGVLFDYKQAGPVLGWSSAIASYGAFVIPAMFAVAIAYDKPETTLYGLAGYYTFCGCLNFWFYTRPGAERPGV